MTFTVSLPTWSLDLGNQGPKDSSVVLFSVSSLKSLQGPADASNDVAAGVIFNFFRITDFFVEKLWLFLAGLRDVLLFLPPLESKNKRQTSPPNFPGLLTPTGTTVTKMDCRILEQKDHCLNHSSCAYCDSAY